MTSIVATDTNIVTVIAMVNIIFHCLKNGTAVFPKINYCECVITTIHLKDIFFSSIIVL